MAELTENETKAILILFKEFNANYNANNLSKVLDISHAGVQKLLKRLFKKKILICEVIGKAIIYKINIKDDFVQKLIYFLLAEEAQKYLRWKEEFKELSKAGRIVMMYGSSIKDYLNAEDIDVMIVMKKEDETEVKHILKEKGKILPKKVHPILLTKTDLIDSLKNNDKVILDIIKNAVILYGQEYYVEVMKDVSFR